MKKEVKLVLFISILAIGAVALVIYRYEKLLKEREKSVLELSKVIGGTKIRKDYTAQEIYELIKAAPEYIGDSITIFENGEMVSSNVKLNGTLSAVTTSEGNMNMVEANMKNNKLPLQYNVYVIAAVFYRQQYPDEFKNEKAAAPVPDSSKPSTK